MKKAFIILGLVSGALIILTGILIMSGAFGVADSYTVYPSYYNGEKYGYAKFGTDYYTYSSNNGAFAAYSANAVNGNIREFSSWLQRCLGMFLIGIGLADLCGFGIAFAGLMNDANKAAAEPEKEVAKPDSRLENLKDLLAKGLITEEEYREALSK